MLESGRAVALSSGMAAIAAVFGQLAADSRVVLPDDCCQGVAGLAEAGAKPGRWSLKRVALDDTAGWIRACSAADLVWIESPSNRRLAVADLEAICAAPRKQGSIIAVDNTVATPLNQRPLAYGATVLLQSATKSIGGHSDLLAGVATARDESPRHALKKSRELTGATPGNAGGLPRRSWRPNPGAAPATGPALSHGARRTTGRPATSHPDPIPGPVIACDTLPRPGGC